MDDPVVLLEPGEERAQKIAKAMASQTAGDILRFISDGQKTSTEISEALSLPMNTAKYHIENLLEAGLISVASTKYSVKGREVKVYSLTNQLLIVAPRQSSARSLLLKYASLFGIVAFGSLVIALLTPFAHIGGSEFVGLSEAPPMAMQGAGGVATKAAMDVYAFNYSDNGEMAAVAARGLNEIAAPNASQSHELLASAVQASTDTVVSSVPVLPLDTAVAFLLGGSFVIFILLCYEISLWKKMRGD